MDTTRHMVFDQQEAKHTSVTFFDDGSGQAKVTLTGGKRDAGETERDHSHLTFCTHDAGPRVHQSQMDGI